MTEEYDVMKSLAKNDRAEALTELSARQNDDIVIREFFEFIKDIRELNENGIDLSVVEYNYGIFTGNRGNIDDFINLLLNKKVIKIYGGENNKVVQFLK